MKSKIVGVLCVGLLSASAWATSNSPESHKLNLISEKDKVSYAIGLQIGQDFKQQGIELNPAVFYQGMNEGFAGTAPQLTAQQVQDTLANFRKKMIAKKQAEVKLMTETNKKQGEKWLAENKSKSGVITLPDGLQYKVIKAGTGVSPKEGDVIVVHYSGKFIDGKEFDSSYQRGKPTEFTLSKDLIPGWVEALQLMKTGSTWELYVPSNLGYGANGIGPIGPNQMLIFKIELISVKPKAAAKNH